MKNVEKIRKLKPRKKSTARIKPTQIHNVMKFCMVNKLTVVTSYIYAFSHNCMKDNYEKRKLEMQEGEWKRADVNHVFRDLNLKRNEKSNRETKKNVKWSLNKPSAFSLENKPRKKIATNIKVLQTFINS